MDETNGAGSGAPAASRRDHRAGSEWSPDAEVSPHSDGDINMHSMTAGCLDTEDGLPGLAVLHRVCAELAEMWVLTG